MARWLFCGSPLVGHTLPTLAVVAELVGRGETVVYFNSERFRGPIEETGAEFRAYRNFPEVPAKLSPRMLDLWPLMIDATEAFLDAEADAIRADPPDYLITDASAFWGGELARLIDIPRIGSVPTMVLNPSVQRILTEIMPPGIRPASSSFRIRDIGMLCGLLVKRLRVERRHGLRYRRIDKILHADYNIVFTSSLLQPCAEEMRGRFCFVGSPTFERNESESFPFEKLSSDPLVYISLGTLFNDNVALLGVCFEALGELAVQVVLSRGRQGADVGLPYETPRNFMVCDYVPQLAMLERAAVFVTNGGIGSASEGLRHGTPLVFLPQVWDNYLMAYQVEKLGGGVRLSAAPSAAELRAAVEKTLADPAYRENSRRIGQSLIENGGASRAADEFQAWAERQRSRRIRGRYGASPRGLSKTRQ